MRLLHTTTLQLQDFVSDIPPYAILSHTWEGNELQFHHLQNATELIELHDGYTKVRNACTHARKYGFNWIWIDSCCINKESSAELSEAINSMYQYYEDAEVCYAYLCDASAEENPRDTNSGFRNSRWFTRGWTLQELLAPSYVVFLDKHWAEIGTKWSLRDAISAITSIPKQILEGGDVQGVSIARRMSWAALRETTRSEDQAYCLMGIFGVSMPPLYGEGSAKAFVRLQLEIIKISDDRSIFAWISPVGEKEPRGLLARSPFEFRASGQVTASRFSDSGDANGNKLSYTFNNNGLHIHLPITLDSDKAQVDLPIANRVFLAALHCQIETSGEYLSVYLQKTADQRYVRCFPDELASTLDCPAPKDMQELIVKENPVPRGKKKRLLSSAQFHVTLLPSVKAHFTELIPQTYPVSIKGSTKTITVCGRRILAIQYRAHRDDLDNFSIVMGIRNNAPFSDVLRKLGYRDTVTDIPLPHNDQDNFNFCPSDRVTMTLESGLRVSLKVHITGTPSERALEVGCRYDSNLYVELQPPRLGFLVPTAMGKIGDHVFSLQETFPPDYFQKRYGKQVYVPIGDTSSTPSFRALSYMTDWGFGKTFRLVVVLGVHGAQTWVDILPLDKNMHKAETVEKIWKSYQPSGKTSVLYRKSASTILNLKLNFPYRLTVLTNEMNRSLFYGSFLVHFEVEAMSTRFRIK